MSNGFEQMGLHHKRKLWSTKKNLKRQTRIIASLMINITLMFSKQSLIKKINNIFYLKDSNKINIKYTIY